MGYDRWAAKHNLKQMAATVTAYQQSGFSSPEKLDEACSAAYTAMQKSITELKNVEKRLNGKRGCNGRCLPIPRPAPSGTGYDENKPRRQDIETFVGKVGLPQSLPDLSDTIAKCRIGTAKFFTLLLLLYHT